VKKSKLRRREYKLTGTTGNYTLKASYYALNPKTKHYTVKKWRVVESKIRTKKEAQHYKYLDSCGGRPF